MPPVIASLFSMVKGPWTATRLGTAALALACFVACGFVPAAVIANVGTTALTTTHAIGALGVFLVGVVMNAPGAQPASPATDVGANVGKEPPKSATG